MNNYEKIGDTVLIELPEEVDDYRASILVNETEEVFQDGKIRYVIAHLITDTLISILNQQSSFNHEQLFSGILLFLNPAQDFFFH